MDDCHFKKKSPGMNKNIYTFLLLFFTTTVFSQTTISGIIKDQQGVTVIGANIYLKDTYDGTSSGTDGTFSFETEETGTQILAISYIGFEEFEQEVQLNGSPLDLTISLTEKANELNTVVITAGAFEASDEKKSVILSSLDIVTTAGSSGDIAGALNTLPGTQTVGEEGQLFVRGGASYETRTFIDGLFVQKPYSSPLPDIPARGRFTPFLFKGTMFSTGGYSAEYGQALSSALILNTYDMPTQSQSGISLMALGLGGSHTQVWDKTAISAAVNYIDLGPYFSIIPQNIDVESPYRGLNGQVMFRQKTSKTGIFKAMMDGSRGKTGINYPNLESPGDDYTLSIINDNFYFNSSFKEVLNDKWSLFSGVAYSYNNDAIEQDFSVSTKEQSSQGKVTLTNNLTDDFKIKVGAEYLHNIFDETFIDTFSMEYNTNLKEDYVGAFAETDIYFSRNFVTRIGGRVEHSAIINKWNIAPRVSLAYKLSKEGQVSFAFGQFFQTPENLILRNSTSVDFEQSFHYMLNYQIIKKTRTFRIEGFYKQYKDLVKYNFFNPTDANNSGDGYARGIDVFFRDRAGSLKKADYWISYSFLDTKRNWRDYPNTSTPYFASRHNLSIVYKQWIPKLMSSIGLTYKYASPRTYDNPNTPEFNDEKTPAYNNLSFNMSYLTNLFGQFTVVFASIDNVPGFKNTFGYRYSNTPDTEGNYASYAIRPPAKRSFFIGCFISIGQTFSPSNGVTN